MSASLKPGHVEQEQFELLLAGTSIRSVKVINALRDHLVSGVPGKDAWSQNGASKAQFYLNLGVIKEESERSRKLAPFYAAAEVADEQ
ncbi:TPA: adhesion biosynthesis transcriptional regulator [Pseudomonas aeruginosa]|nr:adhesion biosynthesis transcriptional regulator [Pseudomonas aeruginosa]